MDDLLSGVLARLQVRLVGKSGRIVPVQAHDAFCREHGPVVAAVAVRLRSEVEIGVRGLDGAVSCDYTLQIHNPQAVRLDREIGPAQVKTRFPQIAHGPTQRFPRRKPLRREISEENGLDGIRAEAATARGSDDERAQTVDSRRSIDHTAWARGEERAAETEGGILGNRRTHCRSMRRKSERRRAAHCSHGVRGLDSNARRRMGPQGKNAHRGERQPGKQRKPL
jgi:hypothetical protein